MTDTFRTIFCVLDGETRSNVFPVSISPTSTVGQLKKLLKAEKSNEFNNIDADKLTLWRVSIPNIDDNESPILLNNIADNEKRRIFPRSLLSDAFPEDIQQQMIHVIMQCPLQTQPDLGIIVHPEKNVSFSWTALLETVTLAGLRGHIFRMYPQYDHDDHLEISVYNGQPKPELICDDEELRKLLKITKITSKTKLTISLGTPTKTFSAWTFKDVCAEYDLTDATDPCIEDLPPFMDIQAATLDTEFQRNMCDELICEVEKREVEGLWDCYGLKGVGVHRVHDEWGQERDSAVQDKQAQGEFKLRG
ncbi:hypothetical protein EDD21DRAFT_349408 [Dissophora ornata]|nr:hypothetical protein EDD21DRAFT_349408 [Dissophora ornata]